jgi:hypothetical protein
MDCLDSMWGKEASLCRSKVQEHSDGRVQFYNIQSASAGLCNLNTYSPSIILNIMSHD